MNEMMCEHCGKKKATFFFEENRNGTVTRVRLCADCAKAAGLMGKSLFDEELFSGFSPFTAVTGLKSEEKCPVCGRSLGEIRKSGKFGCSACYDRFGGRLDLTPFLGRDFVGKPLTEKTQAATEKDAIPRLKKELEAAILHEEYEKAAKLRDEIRGLEGR